MKYKIKAMHTSKMIKLTGLSFNEKPTYINAIATKIVAAISLLVKYLDSNREIIIIRTATPIPEIVSIILFFLNKQKSLRRSWYTITKEDEKYKYSKATYAFAYFKITDLYKRLTYNSCIAAT